MTGEKKEKKIEESSKKEEGGDEKHVFSYTWPYIIFHPAEQQVAVLCACTCRSFCWFSNFQLSRVELCQSQTLL